MSIFWACFYELSVLALSSFVFKNTYALNTCTIALFAGHHQGFRCSHHEHKLFEVVSCHHWQRKLLWFIWGNTRVPVPLISCSAHSSKLPSWLSTPSIDCEEQRKGCMHRTNRIFEETPSPHICLKVPCRKGLEASFREFMVHLHAIIQISPGMLVTTFLHTHTHKFMCV